MENSKDYLQDIRDFVLEQYGLEAYSVRTVLGYIDYNTPIVYDLDVRDAEDNRLRILVPEDKEFNFNGGNQDSYYDSLWDKIVAFPQFTEVIII